MPSFNQVVDAHIPLAVQIVVQSSKLFHHLLWASIAHNLNITKSYLFYGLFVCQNPLAQILAITNDRPLIVKNVYFRFLWLSIIFLSWWFLLLFFTILTNYLLLRLHWWSF